MLGLKAGLQFNAMMEKYSGANEILLKVKNSRLAMPRYKKNILWILCICSSCNHSAFIDTVSVILNKSQDVHKKHVF